MTTHAAAKGGLRGYVVAAMIAVAVSIAVFSSILRHPDSTVLLQPGDASSAARDYWAMAEQDHSPFTFTRDRYLYAPEGQERSPALQIANAVEPLFVISIAPVVGYLSAINLFWFVGLLASIVAMLALFLHLELHPIAAFGGTMGFVLGQWEFEQLLAGHVAFAHLWVFPTTMLALLWAREGGTRRAVLPGVSIGVSFYVSSYFGLFVVGMTAVFLVTCVFGGNVRAEVGRDIRRMAFGSAAFLVVLLPAFLAPLIAPSSELGLPPGARRDLHGSSLTNFVEPSAHNWLYGDVLGVSDPRRVGENVLFWGIALTTLAVLAVTIALRRSGERDLRRVFVERFAMLLIPAGVYLSLPPYVSLGSREVPVPDPAYIIGGFVQWWRFYIRFGILVGFGLAILAALALDALVRARTRRLQLLGWVAALAIALEVLPLAGAPTDRLEPAASDRWLAEHGGGAVAVYPMAPANAPGTRNNPLWDPHVFGSLFLQTRHGHPLYSLPGIQMSPTRTDALRVLTSDLRRPATRQLLRASGIRYVVCDDSVYRSIGVKPPGERTKGLRLVRRFDDVRIFEVVAESADVNAALRGREGEIARAYAFGSASVTFVSGFYVDEQYQLGTARWLIQDGLVRVKQPVVRPFIRHRLRFEGFSNGAVRRVEIWSGPTRLTSFNVAPTETKYTTLVRLRKTDTTWLLRVTPGPAQLGGNDTRDASIYVTNFALDPTEIVLTG